MSNAYRPQLPQFIWAFAAVFALIIPPEALAQVSPFGPPGNRIPIETSGIAGWLLARQAEFHRALSGSIRLVATDPGALIGLIGIAFSYGVLHAIGPGHGKAVIASYLVANESAMKRGIGLAFGAALVQALVALALVITVALVIGGGARQIESIAALVEKIGFAIILAMGLALVWQKGRRLLSVQSTSPDVCIDSDCGHDHSFSAAALNSGGWRELTLTAIGAGIRPCTGAIILLVFALTQKLFWAGAIAVSAMALGTAIGTSAFAILAVKAKALALSMASRRGGIFSHAGLILEVLAGFLLALLGLALLLGAMQAGN